MSCTIIAACTAAIWRTCCGGWRRICEFYGSKPQFICCSATIANPKELAEALTEAPFELVDRNGAPSGEKYFVFYNPPVVNKQLGIRRGYLQETRRIAIEFIERHQQTLVFANSRLATEILVKYLRDAIERGPLPGDAVRGYRGGYLPRERREIERKLRDGEIRAVVATNALELGVDIGSLDAVVMAGYPGSIASAWQRAGRAGRRQSASLAVMVCRPHAEYAGLVGGRAHNAAPADSADDHRQPDQSRIVEGLDGSKEAVHVDMQHAGRISLAVCRRPVAAAHPPSVGQHEQAESLGVGDRPQPAGLGGAGRARPGATTPTLPSWLT